ncbi:F0F1 ATP synthase subunit A [Thermosulfuriphilus ammonigenes]|uniref:ATP synthase subunit a n=1 Tax=Thermosulfuriphilus ammonigenes TaxID=1936021 RepID=A0A6G7PWB3_9BACT|nr:F0F1 ATP synthase subunit A [Thermosulfuriphilus ammonigenes]MBA2847963.1 F-type H+-transporting ATPase subunit a [Thermosulfuriphilus ammonigenes]QIJ71846.1 F0F1 ATP synthase subunit A [Thermosulfuriphilus ammonigenes]
MEHPILFLSLILDKLGLPAYGGNTVLAKLLAPYMVYSYFTCLFLIIIGKWGTAKLELIPRGKQNFFEFIVEALRDFSRDNLPNEEVFRMTFPLIATFFLYILTANLIGLIPGFMSPTANLNVTLGCTLITIVYYHFLGFRFHGLGYLKSFMGPIIWIAPMMIPIEIFSHIGRILSLSFRLFGNLVSKEILLGILVMLAGPFLAPLPVMVLGVLVCFIQALVFIVLSLAYFAGAVEEHH